MVRRSTWLHNIKALPFMISHIKILKNKMLTEIFSSFEYVYINLLLLLLLLLLGSFSALRADYLSLSLFSILLLCKLFCSIFCI